MRVTACGFIAALVLGFLPATHAVAQPATKVFRIGVLQSGSRPSSPDWKQRWPFAEGLRELGWVQGQNIVIEDRWTEGKIERFPDLAAELVRLKVDLIVTVSWRAAVAAKHATTTIPVVFMQAGDPVATGLVASLARPGGNLTGISDLSPETSAKRLELLKEVVPKATRVAILWNATDDAMTLRMKHVQSASRTLGVAVRLLGVEQPEDFEQAFSAIAQERQDALFVIADPLTVFNRKRILDFAAGHRLPTMYEGRSFVDDGGLIAYGPSFAEIFRRGAFYADKILRGAKPADLPVEQPTRFELIVNLKTANALGLTIPSSILVRADKVIQ
jgi:putative ABC transport system substrate-binding protein